MAQVDQAALTRALQSDSDLSSASLATKILVARLRKEVKADPASLTAKTAELATFFQKNTFATRDLAVI
ncbi:MAG: hypothetical protein AAF830_12400 [Pseudomonadota bacterium]